MDAVHMGMCKKSLTLEFHQRLPEVLRMNPEQEEAPHSHSHCYFWKAWLRVMLEWVWSIGGEYCVGIWREVESRVTLRFAMEMIANSFHSFSCF
nr:hypothetical protein Iba_chr09bCG4730 [Ipomoea batatas]